MRTGKFGCLWFESQFTLGSNHATMWPESQVAHDSNHTTHVCHCPVWFESHFLHDSNDKVLHFFLFGYVQIDSNQDLYMTRIMSFHDSNHKVFHFFLFAFVRIDSNQALYMTRIMSFYNSNQSYNMIRITGNETFFLYWSCFILLAHSIQIIKYFLLNSNNYFHLFLGLISNTYKFFLLSHFSQVGKTTTQFTKDFHETHCFVKTQEPLTNEILSSWIFYLFINCSWFSDFNSVWLSCNIL